MILSLVVEKSTIHHVALLKWDMVHLSALYVCVSLRALLNICIRAPKSQDVTDLGQRSE